jgi:lipopolysaccharide/colanic/teichoic acid biosynthesis glycosyltransferase
MLLTALVIRLTSPGPAIYKQERVTKDNRHFWLYKFRTMYESAEDETGPVTASTNDERVTPFGAFLRSARFDEILQFFNVIKGEMSVVGPRPERPFFIEQFKTDFPDYDYRAAVKAGITGYAQLMGNYSTAASDKLRFDLWYIKNYSLWMDITLIVKTVKVLFMKGSVGDAVLSVPLPAPKGSVGDAVLSVPLPAPQCKLKGKKSGKSYRHHALL